MSERLKERNEAHPLNARPLTVFHEWADWKKRWDEEMARDYPNSGVLVGLLHAAFSIRADPSERIPFLLGIADGYRSYSAFPNDYRNNRQDKPKPRQNVARKAWAVLCDNFFKEAAEKEIYDYFWRDTMAGIIGEDVIFKKILWFFDPEGDNIPSHEKDARNEMARVFIKRFIEFVWMRRNKEEPTNQMYLDARPQLVGILSELHALDRLTAFFREYGVDEKSMSKLEEIALTFSYGPLKSNKPKSVEEIFYDSDHEWKNREASRILILLRILQEMKLFHDIQKNVAMSQQDAEYRKRELKQAKDDVEKAKKRFQGLTNSEEK